MFLFSRDWRRPTANHVQYKIHTKVLKLWSAVFHKFFCQDFKQDHSLQMADPFALHREHLFIYSPIFERSTPLFFSSFTHNILDINRRA
jgi:hypothetical protein